MGFLERFQKIKGVQEAAEAASNVLNKTTTGREGGNLGKIEPELQAKVVNPGSVADGDKNPANLVKQQLATTEKPAIAAAVKIEKAKKDAQAQAKTDAQATMQNIMGAVNNPSAVPEVKPTTAKPNIGIQKPLDAAKFYITGGGDPRTNKGGAAAPKVQTVTQNGTSGGQGGTNVAQGGTSGENGAQADTFQYVLQPATTDNPSTRQPKMSWNKTEDTPKVGADGKPILSWQNNTPAPTKPTPTIKTDKVKVEEQLDFLKRQDEEWNKMKEQEKKAERRKENLKAIYGILNGAGAALAGRKGIDTGAKEEGEKVIKNLDDRFTKRMAQAREDLKTKQDRELKAYMLKREDSIQKREEAKQKKEDEQKEKDYQLRVNADKRAEKETESRIKAREEKAKYDKDKLELDYIKLQKQYETDPLKKQQLELREAELELGIKKYEESLKDTMTYVEEIDPWTGAVTRRNIRRTKEGGQGSSSWNNNGGNQGGGNSSLAPKVGGNKNNKSGLSL